MVPLEGMPLGRMLLAATMLMGCPTRAALSSIAAIYPRLMSPQTTPQLRRW